MKAVYAAVSVTTFAAYALAVSAASAPPTVHAAGLILWLAHVILIFGRRPSGPRGERERLGALEHEDALARAADRAAGFGIGEAKPVQAARARGSRPLPDPARAPPPP